MSLGEIEEGVSGMHGTILFAAAGLFVGGLGEAYADSTQATISAPLGTIVVTLHAVGAQIYECKAGSGGALVWTFREPIASLMSDGKTVGRHFAGPTWEMADGSFVVGRVVDKAPGATANDVPWLELDVTQRGGNGVLDGVKSVQRLATVGGNKTGPCQVSGDFFAEPYAADYTFSKP